MKELYDHKANPCNEALKIKVIDEPGPGGANHLYHIFADESNPNITVPETVYCVIPFQNGPIKEAGVNGVTQEALLAVVIDRLRGFQSGQYACRENAIALTKLEEALMWLQKRTRGRVARGVEGTMQK